VYLTLSLLLLIAGVGVYLRKRWAFWLSVVYSVASVAALVTETAASFLYVRPLLEQYYHQAIHPPGDYYVMIGVVYPVWWLVFVTALYAAGHFGLASGERH
jgi:hypothetical protein